MVRLISSFVLLISTSLLFSTAHAQMLEVDVERAGATYMRGSVGQAGPQTCWSLCARDAKCKAWTWERPGVGGPQAMCSLKAAITPGTPSPCCVSGVSAKLEQGLELALGRPQAQATPGISSHIASPRVPVPAMPQQRMAAPAYSQRPLYVPAVPVTPVDAGPRRSSNGVPVYSVNREYATNPKIIQQPTPQAAPKPAMATAPNNSQVTKKAAKRPARPQTLTLLGE